MSNPIFRVVTLAFALALAPAAAMASSHSEAPGTVKDRLADDTDLYAYIASNAPDAVTIVGNWVPLIEPASGPNFSAFDDEAHYYLNVDNVGDAQDHIRFEFTFHTTRQTGATFLYNTGVVTSLDDPDLNVRQYWTLTRNDNGVETQLATGQVAPQYVGPVSMPAYNELAQSAIVTASDGTKVFVGPRDDPFFIDLAATFDLLTIHSLRDNRARDTIAGFNVMTIVLQVPKTRLTAGGAPVSSSNSVIGLYASTERLQTKTINDDGTISISGPEKQVSRLGNPLVNEVVIALADKDRFNATKPPGDFAFLNYVTDPELARLLHLIYNITVPPTPRNDLVAVFLTGVPGLNKPANASQVPCDMLRLNLSIAPSNAPNRLGVIAGDTAGFPNGRRLADDVLDVGYRVVAGVLVPGFNTAPGNELSDGVNTNDVPFLPYFPYVAPPHNPVSNDHCVKRIDKSLRTSTTLPQGTAGAHIALTGANPASQHLLEYSVPSTARVALKIYAVNGRLVRTLVDQDAAAGSFRAVWDGHDDNGTALARGVYFARYTTNGSVSDDKKLILK